MSGLAACKSMRPATVVLEILLPGLSGRTICKEIKAWAPDLPVIVLSALNEVADKVADARERRGRLHGRAF